MIATIIVWFGICVILFIACLGLDMRLHVLKAEVDLLLSDREEFFKTWERMKDEGEVDDHQKISR